MNYTVRDKNAYRKVVDAFKKKRTGATVADITAATALPLEQVKELVPQAADEYSGRLQVTESGEILYSFPAGFKSRYRGFAARLGRATEKALRAAAVVGTWIFKAWILLMLVGYFVLFMAIALLALVASTAASSSGSSDNRSSSRRGGGLGGLYAASYIFDLVIRIWFYSELTKSMDRGYYGRRAERPKGRPLHHAVFSFVFGDGDATADWESRERMAVVAYIQANRGVISLPEYMALTGEAPADAERSITAYCAEFGGSPEATEEGTVVYRFDALLLRADRTDRSFAGLSAPIRRLQKFSGNTKKMNGWFIALNGVNFLFGAYFLFNALSVGPLVTNAQIQGSTYLYAVAYVLMAGFSSDPLGVVAVGLGVVPLLFAGLFYLVPALRYLRLKKENEEIKRRNLRKEALRRVWDRPMGVRPADINPAAEECRPAALEERREGMLKELSAYSPADISLSGDGSPVYSYPGLTDEKAALDRYRSGVSDPGLGDTVFDSHGDRV